MQEAITPPSEIRRKNGVADSLTWLSVGLEVVADLVKTLEQAFEIFSRPGIATTNNNLAFIG